MQLCETCRKFNGGCSWTEMEGSTGPVKFQPVEGWTAQETKNGYKICCCPEYVTDCFDKRPRYGPNYIRDRDKALLSFRVSRVESFARKYGIVLPDDSKALMAAMRQGILEIGAPEEAADKARRWLSDNGFGW